MTQRVHRFPWWWILTSRQECRKYENGFLPALEYGKMLTNRKTTTKTAQLRGGKNGEIL